MNILQKIKDWFKPEPIDFIEDLCRKTHFDSQVRLKISNTMKEIHRRGYLNIEDYISFQELGILLGPCPYIEDEPYKWVINKLILLTNNKYTKEDIEKSCGIRLTSKY